MNYKPRFISGAQCPRCRSLDTVRMYKNGDMFVRDCVDCGFVEETRFDPSVSHRPELDTRVNQPVVEATEKISEPIRLIDTQKNTKD